MAQLRPLVRLFEHEFPFQIDVSADLSGRTVLAIIEFCEPLEVWSEAVQAADGTDRLRIGFTDQRAALEFRALFGGEEVPPPTMH